MSSAARTPSVEPPTLDEAVRLKNRASASDKLYIDAAQAESSAKDDDAKGFYEHFDFEPSPSDPYHLMLIMRDLLRIVGK